MANIASQQGFPITQLRPFHTRHYLDNALEVSPGESQKNGFDNEKTLKWRSAQEPRPDEDTAIAAFVKLVSHIVVLDDEEEYCIQDPTRGRVLISRSSPGKAPRWNGKEYGVVNCDAEADVPTDFSIGAGKVSVIGLRHSKTTG